MPQSPTATGGGQMTDCDLDDQEPVPDGNSWADRLTDLARTAMQCATAIGVTVIGHGGHLF